MKKLNFLKQSALIATVVIATVFTSCKKDRVVDQPNLSITAIVSGSNNFTLLKSALIQAGLTDVLAGSGTYTVFAPNNDAFIAAGLETEAKIKAVPVETLKKILLYHVLGQQISSSAIPTASNTAIKTLAEPNVFVTKNATGVYVNGSMVIQADVLANNGIIHVLKTVLMPPTGDIVQTAQGNPNLTYLVAAVLRASQGGTNVAAALSANGPLTVFAPTNQAFINANFPTIASIQNADPTVLTSILTYHVISARVFSSDLTEGAKPTTLNGGTVTISLTGGAKVKGNKNTSASTISPANIVTTNGVVHVIDQVLLP